MAYNVLIVDDSSFMRTMIIRNLKLCGLDLGAIHEAANGEEGLKVLSGKSIDFALVDIHMPVMNGEEMLEKARKDPATVNLPIIFVSSDSSSSRIELLLQKGAAFIHKPFNPEALRETILTITGEENG